MPYFKSGEILQKAIEIEVKGAAFYRALQAKATDETLKSVFAFLAGKEEAHRETFADMLKRADDFRESFSWDYYDYMAGMQFFSDQGIFEDDKKTVKQTYLARDHKELIETAIQFEQDSIFYYNEMRPLVDAQGKQTLEELIQQERDHLMKLTELLQTLN